MKTTNWLKYWRNSLADAIIANIDLNRIGVKEYFETGIPGTGFLNNELIESLFTKKERELEVNVKSKSVENTKERPEKLFILISPFTLVSKQAHQRTIGLRQEIQPLWIKAEVNRAGKLLPVGGATPRFIRNALSPIVNEGQLIIFSDVDTVDKALAEATMNYESWESYWQGCKTIFNKVTDKDLDNYEASDFIVRKECWVIEDDSPSEASEAIITLYDRLIAQSKIPNLLTRLCNPIQPALRKRMTEEETERASGIHLGQMTNTFPLSESQRTSLYHYFNLKEGEVLAINGPPGTGKTTLIQSVVADLFVKHALTKDYPPVIVAASTNNQAIINIVESFGKVGLEERPLSKRWIPDVTSFALYLASETRAKETDPKILTPQFFLPKVENKEYPERAKAIYIENSNSYFNSTFSSVDEITTHIRKELRKIESVIKKTFELKPGNKIISTLTKWIKWKQQNDFIHDHPKLQEELDMKLRNEAFYLAVHYWEGRALMEIGKKIDEAANFFSKTGSISKKEQWRIRAMLTPCFVSTFYMLPKWFRATSKKEDAWDNDNPLFEFIDLLLVDEAGQVSPEVGMASFALAKKALVIGDIYQIEPVWNATPRIDYANLKRHDLIDSVENELLIDELNDKGFTASSGSIMKIAQSASFYQLDNYSVRGMLLNEHRRCFREIIQISNELAYEGLLKPMRIDQPKGKLSPLLYKNVEGASENFNGSRMNMAEADAIASWIISNRSLIESEYKSDRKTLEELVGIITPFSAQKELIMQKLREAKFDISRMKIGTIHALQGAERRLVIFSSVYTRYDVGTYFFDRNVNMLNVAVSRAQDCFIVFGDRQIFKDSKKPSGILAKHVFGRKENEIV